METPENKDDITYAEEVVVITGSILPGIDGLHYQYIWESEILAVT